MIEVIIIDNGVRIAKIKERDPYKAYRKSRRIFLKKYLNGGD